MWNTTETTNQLICILLEPGPEISIYKTLHGELSENTAESMWKDCKGQRIRKLVFVLYFLVMSEATTIKSHQYECPNVSWTRTKICQTEWGRPQRPKPYSKTIDNGGKLAMGMAASPNPRRADQWLSSTKLSMLKICKEVALYEQDIFQNIHRYKVYYKSVQTH